MEEDRDQACCHQRDQQIVTALKECAQIPHDHHVQANHTDRQNAVDGVITFFRTRFPAKASSDQKQPKSFPLSQNEASYDSCSRSLRLLMWVLSARWFLYPRRVAILRTESPSLRRSLMRSRSASNLLF